MGTNLEPFVRGARPTPPDVGAPNGPAGIQVEAGQVGAPPDLDGAAIVESQRPFAAPEPGDEISVKSDAMPLAYRKLVRQCHDRGWTLPPATPELQLFSLSPPR